MSAQRWADGINMWPNAVGTFKRPLAGALEFKKFVWVRVGLIKVGIKNILKNLKIMIYKIMGYTTSLQNKKTKIDVIPRSCFKRDYFILNTC